MGTEDISLSKNKINKTQIDSFIERKAKEFIYQLLDINPTMIQMGRNSWVIKAENFIRQLYDEMPAKKVRASEGFVRKEAERVTHDEETEKKLQEMYKK